MTIKKPLINYTARDFASIKQDLLNYAQKYYPEAYKDFNEASFGSLMVDMVSYVGDMLSFYVDYQANESFMETAMETDNIIKLGKSMGYKFRPNPASHGQASFFVSIPSQITNIAPDYSYAPVLKRGTVLSTADGRIFTLVGDVDFSQSNDVVVATANADATSPSTYAVKSTGLVMSGELVSETYAVGDYERFRQIIVEDPNLTEIVSVYDGDGNNYYEVDYLSQDTVYQSVVNTKEDKDSVRNILKPIAVPRRFVVEQTFTETILQFGYGTENNEQRLLDPASVILDIFGKDYITDKSFDPTVLIKTDKLGVVPTNTAITVIYRRNTAKAVNVAPANLTTVVSPSFKFLNRGDLTISKIRAVEDSLEVINEEAINGDVSDMTTEELKLRAYGSYGAQNRAVTKEDYVNMIYNMPSNFGQVKKAAINRDTDSFNGKNLNLYVISTDSLGVYRTTNSTIKQNLKTWISKYKMVGDTIDILDAQVQNLQMFFTIVPYATSNKNDVLETCLNRLSTYYMDTYFDIGEPFRITDIYKVLNSVPSVLDVKNVSVTPVSGQDYSSYGLTYEELISTDGRLLIPPSDVIFEVKYPLTDIDGSAL